MPRHLVAACALGLLVLSGCGGEPEEPEPEPTKATASPTSTTPAVPALPEAAKANTKAGAIAFVRHYVDLLNAAQFQGNIRPLREASDPRCRSCQSVIKRLSKIHGSKGTVQGGEWTLQHVNAQPIPVEGVRGFTSQLQISSTRQVVQIPGRKKEVYDAGTADLIFNVFFDHGRWRLASWHRG